MLGYSYENSTAHSSKNLASEGHEFMQGSAWQQQQ